jgi:hypothetical protein
VTDALKRGNDVLIDADMAEDMDEDEDFAASGRASQSAYIEVLRYAPCLIAFHQRAQVFQQLIDFDKQVCCDMRSCSEYSRLLL